MKKFLFHFIIIFVVSYIVFSYSLMQSNAANVALPTALWNSFNIASEYYLARAGKSIVNSHKTEGLDTGLQIDTAYGNVVNSNVNVGNILNDVYEMNLSDLSQQELLALEGLATDSSWNGDPYALKAITIGGITLKWLVDKATGAWVGSSENNIVVSINEDAIDLDIASNNAESLYPDNSNVFYTSNFRLGYGSVSQYLSFNYPVYFFTTGDKDEGYYLVYLLYDYTSYGDIRNSFRSGRRVFPSSNSRPIRNIRSISFGSTSTWTYNGHTYRYGLLYPEVEDRYGSYGFGRVYSDFEISSLEDVQNYISNSVPYAADIVDEKDEGYVVPSLGHWSVGIGDIYPALDSLRSSIGSVTDTLDNVLSVTDSIADSIADAIADAIAKGLAITDNPSIDPSPDVPELPEWLWPSFIPNLFGTDGMFSIFKPVFDIVGTNFSMYEVWIMIPTIFIFVLIVYLIVSFF